MKAFLIYEKLLPGLIACTYPLPVPAQLLSRQGHRASIRCQYHADMPSAEGLGYNNSSLQPLCHILTPVGCLGFGLDEDVCAAELAQLTLTNIPTAIILDSGSTDSGPGKLALGTTSAPRSAYVRDLAKLLRLVHRFGVKLLFSSAGGDGSGKHVDEILEVIREVVEAEQRYAPLTGTILHSQLTVCSKPNTKCLAIYADVAKDLVRQRLANGQVSGSVL